MTTFDIIEYSSCSPTMPARNFYDPHRLYNTKAFTIKPENNQLLLITGHKNNIDDKIIYPLHIDINGYSILTSTNQQLCIIVTNMSSSNDIYVDDFQPLSSLLKMPHIHSQLCHVSVNQLKIVEKKLRAKDFTASNTTTTPPTKVPLLPAKPPVVTLNDDDVEIIDITGEDDKNTVSNSDL